MSRWKRLEKIEQGLPDMSADEIRAALEMWRKHMGRLGGPALKSAQKVLHKLERAHTLKSAAEEASAED